MTVRKRGPRCQFYDWRSNFAEYGVEFRYCSCKAVGAVRIRSRAGKGWGRARPACRKHWRKKRWLPILAGQYDYGDEVPEFYGYEVVGWRDVKAVPLSEYSPSRRGPGAKGGVSL